MPLIATDDAPLFEQEGALREEEALRALDALCARRLSPLQLALHIILEAEAMLLQATDVARVVAGRSQTATVDGVVAAAAAVCLPSPPELERIRDEEGEKLRARVREVEARRCLRQVQNATHFDFDTVLLLQRRFAEVTDRQTSEQPAWGGEPEEPAIDLSTFREVLLAAVPDSASMDDEMVAQIFGVADVSGDGKLQFSELASMLSIICKGTFAERTRLVFRSYDRDGSGAIDHAEMVSALRNMYLVHGGEEATPDDAIIEAQATSVFEHCDLDKDGVIDDEEFLRAVALDPRLLACFQVIASLIAC